MRARREVNARGLTSKSAVGTIAVPPIEVMDE